MTFTKAITVKTVPPFDFELSAQIFRSGDPQIRTFSDGVFSQALRINDKLVLVKLKSKGTVEAPTVRVEVKSNSQLSPTDSKQLQEAVKFIFNLNFPLQSFYDEIRNDPIMSRIAQQLYGLKNPTTPTVFEALVDSIVEQQISIKVAHTIEERMIKKFGETLTIDSQTYYFYPTPQNVSNKSLSEVQSCGLSQRKTEYIWGAAKLITDDKLDLEGMKNQQNPDKIIAELDEIRGIGVWTAELTMLRGMQKLDALPADDFGIKRVISRYYCGGKSIKTADARQIAQAWGTWKGLAAFYLIIAEVKNLQV